MKGVWGRGHAGRPAPLASAHLSHFGDIEAIAFGVVHQDTEESRLEGDEKSPINNLSNTQSRPEEQRCD